MTNNQKKGVLIGIAVVVVLVIAVVIFGSKSSNPKEDNTAYKYIEDIPGCEFAVSKDRAEAATAVTEISKNVKFLDYETYSYRNGEDLYILFNMNDFIVIAKKGTSFNLSSTDVSESFANNNLQGIWFEETSKVKKKDNTYTVEVNAEVTITNTLYNDFKGKLVTIEDSEEEWALFTGYAYERDDSEETVKYIASSFVTVSNEYDVTYDTVLDIDTCTVVDVAETVPQKETESSAEEVVEEVAVEEPSETVSEEPDGESLSAESTRRQVVEDESLAYSSTKYSMLPVGSIGFMQIENEDTTYPEIAYINVIGINDSEETAKLIEEYTSNPDNKKFMMPEVPEGCHLESVEYKVRYASNERSYVNIKLMGVDGDVLRYRGLPYSSKTYDINKEITEENDWYDGYVAFFVVPNGCTEYSICAGGVPSIDQSAWYFVSTR